MQYDNQMTSIRRIASEHYYLLISLKWEHCNVWSSNNCNVWSNNNCNVWSNNNCKNRMISKLQFRKCVSFNFVR